jgi:hypothetical protein
MCYRSQKSTLVSHTKQFNPTYNAINKLFSLYGSKKKKLYSADITELFDIKNNKNVDV